MADQPTPPAVRDMEIAFVAAIRDVPSVSPGTQEFTAAQSVLAARAVLASEELQAVRRLIAAALAQDVVSTGSAALEGRLDAAFEFWGAIDDLPGSVRVWATQPETGAS